MPVRKVALLTAGGLAPVCPRPSGPDPEVHRGRSEYRDRITSTAITDCCSATVQVTQEVRGQGATAAQVRWQPDRANTREAHQRGGLCQARPVQLARTPLQVAAEQLTKDGVDVRTPSAATTITPRRRPGRLYLHNNDTNSRWRTAQDHRQRHHPHQAVAAHGPPEQGSIFAQNIIAEHTSNPRMLIIHEVMGRNCGGAIGSHRGEVPRVAGPAGVEPGIGLTGAAGTSMRSSCPRWLRHRRRGAATGLAVMDEVGCVNIFLSEAGVAEIVS